MNNNKLIEQAAAFKTDARKAFEKAVAALVDLAFKYSRFGENFLWDSDAKLNDEANAILREMSDSLAEKAKTRAMSIIQEQEWAWGDEAWDDVSRLGDEPLLTRLDQQGSFLRELLEIWVALAFVNGLSKNYINISVVRYLSNPYASPFWRGLPPGLLKHGTGYQKNLIEQLALIGQDAIIGSVHYAEWLEMRNNGAAFYVRRRGSDFNCPTCQSLANTLIPIETPWDYTHPRCVCWAEYYDAEGKKI